MKIVMIHGQSHEGSTCMVARELAGKVGGELREFSSRADPNRSLPASISRPRSRIAAIGKSRTGMKRGDIQGILL